MCAVMNRAEFEAMTVVAMTEELQDDNSLKFKGKHMVVLKWMDLNQPKAFSILAMFHLAATATSSFTLSGEEEVRLHLKSTEGLGLSDADIAKATKILLVAPTNADMLAKMLGVMMCVLSTILGEAAPLSKATTHWVDHIGEHKMTNNNMKRANPAFPLQLACLIDKHIQLYLRACNKASSPDDISEVDLSIQLTQQQILDGLFPQSMPVPGPLQGQLNCICGSGGNTGRLLGGGSHNDSSSSDEERGNRPRRHRRRSKGNVVTNPCFQEKLRVPSKMMGFLISRLTRANIGWGR